MLAQNLVSCPLSWLLPGPGDQSTCTAVTHLTACSVSPELCHCLLPTAVAVPHPWHREPHVHPMALGLWLLQLAGLFHGLGSTTRALLSPPSHSSR